MWSDNCLMYVLVCLNHIDGSVDKYIERFINAIMKRQGKYCIYLGLCNFLIAIWTVLVMLWQCKIVWSGSVEEEKFAISLNGRNIFDYNYICCIPLEF